MGRVRMANSQTVHLKHFSLGYRGTFKMVNVPMLRKTFCPHPDCKGTKPFRMTNYKSLNEEVTSRKRRFDKRNTRKLLFKTECTVCKWKTQSRSQQPFSIKASRFAEE